MLLTKGVLLVLLAACSNPTQTTTSSDAMNFSYASSSAAASSTHSPPGSNSISIVSCSGDECSVTLGGTGSTVGIFGTTISFVGIQDGRATIRVGDQDVSCTEGQAVAAGPLTLRCTRVGGGTVEFTASPA
ncbi:MAG: hypothetical protein M3Q47_10800 [Actinomycetota bacterium]|nr:hypothetical protein [Actinomycetota bacterium]